MRAVEFQAQVGPNQTLSVPSDIAADLPHGQLLRVLVLIPDTGADRDWEELAAADFGGGYSDSDAIYDDLSAG